MGEVFTEQDPFIKKTLKQFKAGKITEKDALRGFRMVIEVEARHRVKEAQDSLLRQTGENLVNMGIQMYDEGEWGIGRQFKQFLFEKYSAKAESPKLSPTEPLSEEGERV